MRVSEIVKRARACCALIPERVVTEKTLESYQQEFRRMWNSKSLDPLKEGLALDTYYYRRAALHTGGKLVLEGLIEQYLAAEGRQDVAAQQDWARKLLRAVERIEPAFKLEPPAPPDTLPWERPPSRWSQSANSDRRRGANSKQHVLADLPEAWTECLWATVPDGWPHLEALAVHLVVPVRPEELVPGQRPNGRSPGVILEMRSSRCLAITFAPVKSHAGLYGTEITTITVDPTIAGHAAAFLASRCANAGGHLVICISSKNAIRKAVAALGRKALPETGVVVTPYVIRNQLLADLKATFGGGEKVAAAAGHGTDRTQARYGRVQHGRKRKGYLAITAARPPRVGNVERGKQLEEIKTLQRSHPGTE
jgi:hypothetical protein